MTRPVNALCNHCDKITDVVFRQRYHPNKVQETFFKCEHCHYHYTSFVTDAWVRKKQRALKLLPRNNGKLMQHAMALDAKQREINNRMSELKHNLINFGRADL